MNYRIRTTLRRRGAVDQAADEQVEGSLLVGDPICDWDENHSSCGHDFVTIAPAFHNGERAWVLTSSWIAASGYSANGVEDEIISFEEGVRTLLSQDAYAHLFERRSAS